MSTANQYLLVFALRGIQGSPSAQFFVGVDWVRTEQLNGDQQTALLAECPGTGVGLEVVVRLASAYSWAAMGFKGVECYLL